jgi:hypothetical protein
LKEWKEQEKITALWAFGKKREKKCALARLGKFAFRIILLARGL